MIGFGVHPFGASGLRQQGGFVARLLPCLPLACLLLAGCEKQLPTEYGRRSGPSGTQSVNGLGVLASMFEQAGHEVSTAHWLSPSVAEKADVIVWAPDDTAPPTKAVRDWFENWWWQGEGKTLIYIGRDYDAETTYWQKMLPDAPEEERAEIKRRLQKARTSQSFRRSVVADKTDCDWFTIQTGQSHRDLRTLEGDESWLADVDPSKVEIEQDNRLIPAEDSEILFASGDDVLVSQQDIGFGRLIIVSNGSFLLNLPLVNHEHRKLAGKLIDMVDPHSNVVFLETETSSPPIHEKDPQTQTRGGLDILGVEPLNRVFLHLAVLGIIFCFARLPIFGRPRPLPAPPASDFGQHVEAVGDLLAKTGDSSYAASRLLHYQQSARHETSSGPSRGSTSKG